MDNKTSKNPSGEHTEINVGKDVSDSVIINGSGNVVNVGEKKSPKKAPRKGKPKKTKKPDVAIIVAVISVIGTIVAALLNSPLLQKWTTLTPTSFPTMSMTPVEILTATEYLTATPLIVIVTSTELPITPPTLTFTPTLEDTAAVSPSPESGISKMTALLQATTLEGRAPLMVNFDARTSYVQFSMGNIVPCGNNNFCSYVFAIYRDSKFVERISNNEGMLSYTFGGKGKYFVTVYTCRGEACNDDGVTINVK